MYALESLAQSTSLETPGLITTAPLTIVDAPEFPMRGLMINPSIQFLPIPFLKVRTTGAAPPTAARSERDKKRRQRTEVTQARG